MQRQNNWRRHSGRGNNRSSGGGGRGRGSRQGGNISKNGFNRDPLRQQIDSNGPLGRVRGNAMQIIDKYLMLAKEVMSDGDRVLSESCMQYAEHYQRLIIEHQGHFKPSEEDMGGDAAYGDGETSAVESMPRRAAPRNGNGDGVRIMGRGVVRYLDDDNDDNDANNGARDDDKDGADLPSFLTGSQRNTSRRKQNDDDE